MLEVIDALGIFILGFLLGMLCEACVEHKERN